MPQAAGARLQVSKTRRGGRGEAQGQRHRAASEGQGWDGGTVRVRRNLGVSWDEAFSLGRSGSCRGLLRRQS